MIYKMIFGDWSDDGHGKTETFIVDIDATKEELVEAYTKAKEEFGFGVENMCEGYEEGYIDADQMSVLINAGFNEKDHANVTNWNFYWYDDGKLGADAGLLYDILVFMLRHQIPELKAKVVTEDYPLLFGGYGSALVGSESVGYGLFH